MGANDTVAVGGRRQREFDASDFSDSSKWRRTLLLFDLCLFHLHLLVHTRSLDELVVVPACCLCRIVDGEAEGLPCVLSGSRSERWRGSVPSRVLQPEACIATSSCRKTCVLLVARACPRVGLSSRRSRRGRSRFSRRRSHVDPRSDEGRTRGCRSSVRHVSRSTMDRRASGREHGRPSAVRTSAARGSASPEHVTLGSVSVSRANVALVVFGVLKLSHVAVRRGSGSGGRRSRFHER